MFGAAGKDAGEGLDGIGNTRSRKRSQDGFYAIGPEAEGRVVRRKSPKPAIRMPSTAMDRQPAGKSDTLPLGSAPYRRGADGRLPEYNNIPFADVPNGADEPVVAAVYCSAKNGGGTWAFPSVQQAVQQERRRIARDLHDHAGQYLVGLALRLAALEQTIADTSNSSTFAELRQLLSRLGDELRAIAVGEHRGVPIGCQLTTALMMLSAQWECETGITVRFQSDRRDGVEPDDATTEAVFRIAQEALTNVAKHAANASCVFVRLELAPELATLVIEDNGPGFTSPCENHGRPARRGGISNMQERLAERGGQLVICCPPSGGTQLTATVPI